MGPYDTSNDTNWALNKIYSDAGNSSAEKQYQGLIKGTENAGQFLSPNDSFNSGVNYNDSGMLGAIRSRANKGYQLEKSRFDVDTKRMSQEMHQEKLLNASDLASKEAQMNLQKEILARQKRAAKKRARSGVLSSVLGIGGAIAGGVIGGPTGVMAGGAIGSGVGSMVGEG